MRTSQYKVVMSDKDLTKMKLKLIQVSTLHSPSTDHSYSHVPSTSSLAHGSANQIDHSYSYGPITSPLAHGSANQIDHSYSHVPSTSPLAHGSANHIDHSYSHVPSTSPLAHGSANQIVPTIQSSTTSILNKQVPSSSASHFENNSTTGTASSSTYPWHIPAPVSHPAVGYHLSLNNWQKINQGESPSSATAEYSKTMLSQTPSTSNIVNNNAGGTGSNSASYSGYGVNFAPSNTGTSSMSMLPPPSWAEAHERLVKMMEARLLLKSQQPKLNSYSTSSHIPNQLSFPTLPQSSFVSNIYNNSQKNGITPAITPTTLSPAITSAIATTAAMASANRAKNSYNSQRSKKTPITPTTTPRTITPAITSEIATTAAIASAHRNLKRNLETTEKSNAKQPRVPRPKKKQFVRPPVTAIPPMPPNWLESCEDTIMSLHSLKKYKIDPSTMEYQTITRMLHPVVVKGVDKVVNPDLWKRFVNTRKEMLRSKTDDLNILPKLGLDEHEVLRCAHLTLNYNKDPLLLPYSENMVLLFHCTRNQTNLSNILNQGLDERLSSITGGLLGKGIYFADDPQKSIQYDGTGCVLIFAVLLGDCTSVDHFPNKSGLVREPEKVTQQKRNFNDHFFDSIVARPGNHNEYVIYNRYQCCPIYQVEYGNPVQINSLQNNSNYATRKLPPIAWIPEGTNYSMPVQKVSTHWPFYAVDLFKEMGVTPPTDEDNTENEINSAQTEANTPQTSIDEKLGTLLTLGYYDVDRNKEILSKFYYDLEQTVNYFLDNENVSDVVAESNQPSTSSKTLILSPTKNLSTGTLTTTINSATSSTLPQSKSIPSTSGISIPTTAKDLVQSFVTIDLMDDDSEFSDDDNMTIAVNDLRPRKVVVNTPDPSTHLPEDLEFDPNYVSPEPELKLSPSLPELDVCLICYNEYESFEISPSLWKELQCSHKLCLACHSNILTTRSTMSSVQHTFVKCPFCQGTSGIEVGTCPDLQMNVSVIRDS